jgi:branched-chain amino acid transport system permease protein
LLLFLRGVVLVTWGGMPRAFPAVLPTDAVAIGPFTFAPAIFWGGLLSLAVTVVLTWFFERTRWGLRLSVVAEDQVVAQSMGVSVRLAVAVAWMIAMVLGGLAAIVFCNAKTLTFLASDVGFRALPVALLGGMESVRGAPLAGLIIGISEMLARGYIDPLTGGGMSVVVPYIIMIIVVLVRPQGLYGWRIIERV